MENINNLRLPDLEASETFGHKVVKRAVLFVLAGLAGVFVVFAASLFFIRFDVTITAPAVLEPDSVWHVYSPASGIIETIIARPGRPYLKESCWLGWIPSL